jgi:hypothetical protein
MNPRDSGTEGRLEGFSDPNTPNAPLSFREVLNK